MSVYLDLAFIISFLFDFELIMLAHIICSKKIHPFRVFFSAFVGGMQGVLVFFPYFGILSMPPASFAVSVFMAAVCTDIRKKREFLSFYIVFLSMSFLLAGMMMFVNSSTLMGILLIFPVWIVAEKIKKTIFARRSNVVLYLGNKSIESNALYDSGNAVFYLGKPVILANREIFCKLFGKDFQKNDLDRLENVCKVPYKAVGNSGILTGVILDKAVVNGKSYEGVVLVFFEGNFDDDVILNRIMV